MTIQSMEFKIATVNFWWLIVEVAFQLPDEPVSNEYYFRNIQSLFVDTYHLLNDFIKENYETKN